MRKLIITVLSVLLFVVGTAGAQEILPRPQILTFTTSATMVDRTQLNNRTARIPVSWTTANRPNSANLVFEQVLPDGRVVNVELPRDNPWVNSNGDGVAAPFPPGGNATSILLRVRLIDTVKITVYDEKTITLPIGDAPVQTPVIRSFTTSATNVGRNALNNRSARIPVSWAVDNRPDGSNLVFEQVLANGTSVNVELPRPNPYVASSGNGVAAPVPPGGNATSIQLRLRVIDLASQRTLAQQDITLPIVENDVPTITLFSTTTTSVSRASLNNRTARIPVSWAVTNRPPNSNLVFEQVLDNGSVINVELPRQNPYVASEGVGVAAPANPGAGTTVKLQVRLIDLGTQAELAKRELSVSITESAAPRITLFTTTTASVDITALNNRTARIPVSWNVDNRPDGSNLVFEQVLANGTSVNVELPRPNPYVASSGNGVTAPIPPGAGMNLVQLRLRLVNLSDGATIDMKEVTVPITGLTPQPNAPEILSFTVNPTTAKPGETVTLSWETRNATRVTLTNLPASLAAAPANEVTGTTQVVIPSNASGTVTFELIAANAAGQETRATTTVNVTEALPQEDTEEAPTCPFNTSLADTCPVTQETLGASYQPFERGFMVWNGTTRMIYVMFNDGTWQEFADTWTESEPTLPDTGGEPPPAGQYVPQRGFGKVWLQLGGHAALGWATSEETTYQATWENHPMSDADQTVNTPHFTLPDGRVIHLGINWSVS
jgi:hypothetical protein